MEGTQNKDTKQAGKTQKLRQHSARGFWIYIQHK